MLNTKSWTPSIFEQLKAGDYLSFEAGGQRQFHIVTEDIDSNAGGLATINIAPAMRNSPLDNEPIEVLHPTAIMGLADDDQVRWALQKRPDMSSISIQFLEFWTPE